MIMLFGHVEKNGQNRDSNYSLKLKLEGTRPNGLSENQDASCGYWKTSKRELRAEEERLWEDIKRGYRSFLLGCA